MAKWVVRVGQRLRHEPRPLQEDYNKEPVAKRCSYTVQYLQEIEMMTHADYFVGAPHLSCVSHSAPAAIWTCALRCQLECVRRLAAMHVVSDTHHCLRRVRVVS